MTAQIELLPVTTDEAPGGVSVRSSAWLGRVLVACEYSGSVRDAFAALGWDAWSCDLLPSEKPGQHLQCDAAIRVLHTPGEHKRWDIVIAHPPCTYLANSGVRWLYNKDASRNEERWRLMEQAAGFFKQMLASPAAHVAVENPIMHKHAKTLIGVEPTQIIQPWQHGHGETKSTCLWLKNLPRLTPSNIVEGREQRIWKMPPSADRWKERSRTLPGVAGAMANQWTLATRPNDRDEPLAVASKKPIE